MMKILVTGSEGQLGYDTLRELENRGINCVGADIHDFDITDAKSADEYISSSKPDGVIHCAAYTAVDRAEDEKEKCALINTQGSCNIAKSCEKIGAKMIYISTDYVFGGDGTDYYETDAQKNPCNVYGKTKLEGEKEVQKFCTRSFIVRTSWVFGKNGNNFVKTMKRLGSERDSVSVVCDQVGSPTYTRDLARLLCDMIVTDKYGVYHATNEGVCSWAEFSEEIMKNAGLNTEVVHISTAEFAAKALRPLNSRLSKRSLDEAGFKRLPDWKDALERYMEEIK